MGQIVGGLETKHLVSLNGLEALVHASGHFVDPMRWRDGIQGMGDLGDVGDIQPITYLGIDEQYDYGLVNPASAWGMFPPSAPPMVTGDGSGGDLGDLGASLTPGLHALHSAIHSNPVNPTSRNSGLRWMGPSNKIAEFVDEQTDNAARGGTPGTMDLPTFYNLSGMGDLGCPGCMEGLG